MSTFNPAPAVFYIRDLAKALIEKTPDFDFNFLNEIKDLLDLQIKPDSFQFIEDTLCHLHHLAKNSQLAKFLINLANGAEDYLLTA